MNIDAKYYVCSPSQLYNLTELSPSSEPTSFRRNETTNKCRRYYLLKKYPRKQQILLVVINF